MHYDLSRLGELQFEHLAQALAAKNLTADLSIFGAGRDGGREATWNGPAGSGHLPTGWNGYGVMQAKFRNHADDASVGSNAKWLIAQIKEELNAWMRPKNPRTPIPACYLIVTNVRLSAVPGSGIDLVVSDLIAHAKSLGLSTSEFSVWSYDKLRVLLDGASDIRSAYAAWVTPGDVLSQIFNLQAEVADDLKDALSGHAAKNLTDALNVNLSQAGSVSDSPTALATVFMDLPAYRDAIGSLASINGHGSRDVEGICAELVRMADQKLNVTGLGSPGTTTSPGRAVLVGGPGQGKSTVGQYLCQVYRAAFLDGSSATQVREVSEAIAALKAKSDQLIIPQPVARRWPIHVTLTVLADSLASGHTRSLLEFVAVQVADRSGIDVTTTQMRSWLRSYPWFLVLDGLDEVPSTSNRRAVLSTVSDFFIDAATLDADIMVVATTRPQGYSHDFNPEVYQHFSLSELPVSKALSYAEGLIALRVGSGERFDTVVRQLRRAADQPATARLMTTPLQTTIISFLIERIGQAPEERWRLFSEYYRVIYQREQSKPGELAALLTDYKTDVDAVHYTAALALQRGGERSGETQAVLSDAQLREIFYRRLISQGHDPEVASRLVDTLLRATTDRLVFLAVLRESTVGFEIRSLQEFMAAAALAAQSETDFADDLRRIATSSYWQNVVLFALGAIFAEKAVLCGEAATLIADLNLSDSEPGDLFPGSRLALEVLLDGIARRVPRYHRLLLEHVSKLVDLSPDREIAARIAELDSLGYAQDLDRLLGTRPPIDDGSRVMQVLIGACRAALGHPTAHQVAANLIPQLSSRSVYFLLEIAVAYEDDTLLALLAPAVRTLGPATFQAEGLATDSTPWADSHDPTVEVPGWLTALRALSWATAPHDSSGLLSVELVEQAGAELHIPILGAHQAEWRTLLAEDGIADLPGFQGIRELGNFALQPTATSLADALAAVADAPPGVALLAANAGWPLAACVTHAAGGRVGKVVLPEVRSQLLSLSDEARDGLLGDATDWENSQESWKNGVSYLQQLQYLDSGETESVIGLGARAEIFPINAVSSWSRSSKSTSSVSWMPAAAKDLIRRSCTQTRRQTLSWLLFWSAVEDEGRTAGPNPRVAPLIGALSELDLSDVGAICTWLGETDWNKIGFVGSLNPDFFASPDSAAAALLHRVGSEPFPGHVFGSSARTKWDHLLIGDAMDWPITRLRLIMGLGLPLEWIGMGLFEDAEYGDAVGQDSSLRTRTFLIAGALDYKTPLATEWEELASQLLVPGHEARPVDQLDSRALLREYKVPEGEESALRRALYLVRFFRTFDPLSGGPLSALCWQSYTNTPVNWEGIR